MTFGVSLPISIAIPKEIQQKNEWAEKVINLWGFSLVSGPRSEANLPTLERPPLSSVVSKEAPLDLGAFSPIASSSSSQPDEVSSTSSKVQQVAMGTVVSKPALPSINAPAPERFLTAEWDSPDIGKLGLLQELNSSIRVTEFSLSLCRSLSENDSLGKGSSSDDCIFLVDEKS
ncbi:MAG: hypothetical protein WCP39_00155 [Chlamydiota bacterium]